MPAPMRPVPVVPAAAVAVLRRSQVAPFHTKEYTATPVVVGFAVPSASAAGAGSSVSTVTVPETVTAGVFPTFTVPLTGCVAGKLFTPTVPETGCVAGKLPTLTVPLTGCVAGKFPTFTVPSTVSEPLLSVTGTAAAMLTGCV